MLDTARRIFDLRGGELLSPSDPGRHRISLGILYLTYFFLLNLLIIGRGLSGLLEFPYVLFLIIPYFIVALRSPVLGLSILCLFQLTQLKSLTPVYGEFLSLSILIEICLLAALVFQFLMTRRFSNFKNSLSTLTFLFLGFYFVAAFWRSAPSSEGEGGPVKELLLLLFIYVCLVTFIESWEKLLPLLRSFLLLILFWFGASVFHILKYGNEVMIVRTQVEQGYIGHLIDPNHLAASVLMFLPLAYFLLTLERSAGWRILAMISFICAVLTVVLTFSRNGFVTLVVVSALLLYERKRSPRILPFLLIVILIAAITPSSYWNRMTTITSLDAPTGLRLKFSHIQRGMEIVLQNPLFGIGLRKLKRAIHNTSLQVAVEVGLPAMIMFWGLLWTALKELTRTERFLKERAALARSRLPSFLIISLVAYFMSGLTISITLFLPFIVILGLTTVMRNLRLDGSGIPDVRADR